MFTRAKLQSFCPGTKFNAITAASTQTNALLNRYPTTHETWFKSPVLLFRFFMQPYKQTLRPHNSDFVLSRLPRAEQRSIAGGVLNGQQACQFELFQKHF